MSTCSEPLLWNCGSCGHSFHAEEWQKQGRQCPACLEKKGNWKCSLCLESFSQPALQGEHPCKRKNRNGNADTSPQAQADSRSLISAGIALLAWLRKSRLVWGIMVLLLGISAGGLGVHQFVQRSQSARKEPDIRYRPSTSAAGSEKAGAADYNRGVAYLQGKGVPKDEEEAVRWVVL